MPIIYMHGVNTRDPLHFDPIKEYLQRIVAPAISPNPENVSIQAADWFSFCPAPKWEGISRPRTPLLGQGPAAGPRNEVLDAIAAEAPRSPVASSGGFTAGRIVDPAQGARLDRLPREKLADLIVLAIKPPKPWDQPETEIEAMARAHVGIAADRVAHDDAVHQRLVMAPDLDAQLKIVADEVAARVSTSDALRAQGPVGDFFRGMRDHVAESISRAISAPAASITVVASELRPPLNDFVTRFLGDVLFYMTRRGTPQQPGDIPKVLLQALAEAQHNKNNRNGEPIVLLTHSMGGQIAYDVLTSFLPAQNSDIKVDFWCATASQIGFFEELNLFLASSTENSKKTGKRTPVPTNHLGSWWNVWDPNDIISFTTKGIFADGVDDEEFWSGKSVAAAHGGYLERPSFYRSFAEKLKAARRTGTD